MAVSVRLGFVPSYRFRWTPWTQRMKEESVAVLSRLLGVEVVAPGPSSEGAGPSPEDGSVPHGGVHTLDEAEAVAEYFRRQGVDGLVLCPLDFGDERSACKVAETLRVPVFLYATKEPPAVDDVSLARVSDSYCGNLSIAAGLTRRRIPFQFGGIFFPDEPEFQAEADTFARAVAVVKGLRGARIGQVGVRPASFETVAYDEVAMARTFGQNVVQADLTEMIEAVKRLPDDDPKVQDTLAGIRGSVRQITVADDHLRGAAKLEVVLLDFAQRNRLSALAMQCWPTVTRSLSLSVCALFGRLTQRGLLTACEADVLGALSMLVQYQAALGETVPHFIDWTIQHREDPNRLLAWHCGNAPACLARDPGETALRSRRDMVGAQPPPESDPMAGLHQFQLRPGPVTFCRLDELDGEWRMLIATGEIVPSEERLAGTWSWVRVSDHARLYRTLVEEGFIHHASMIHGDQVGPLLAACKLLGIRPVVVS